MISSFVTDFGEVYESLNFSYDVNGTFAPDPDTLPCEHFTLSDSASSAVSAFYGLVFALALPGNLCVFAVMGSSNQPLPPSDLYLLHLAGADVLLAATLPFWAWSVSRGWSFGDAACKIITIVQELSFYSSIVFLTCISVDRYLVIVRALDSRRWKRRSVSWLVCALVWLVGALLSLPGFFSSASSTRDSEQATCREHFDPGSADAWRLATRALRHSLGFALPLAVMLTCYGVTVRRLLLVRDGFRKQKAMRVIVAVVTAFLLCWAPYHMTVMADTFLRSRLVQYACGARLAVDKAMLACHSLGLLHSGVNPVLYAFIGEKFRRRFSQILKKVGLARTSTAPRCSRSSVSSEITSAFM